MTTAATAEGFPTQLAPIDEAAQAALFTQARTVNSFSDTPV
ncbi:hypothetical protein ACFY6U_10070 [Streptomyces sp. NPDC013157]